MSWSHLRPEQAERAEQILQPLRLPPETDLRGLAELLARKEDSQLLGPTEFEVRDRVHKIGAKALETAVDQRKKSDCVESPGFLTSKCGGNPGFQHCRSWFCEHTRGFAEEQLGRLAGCIRAGLDEVKEQQVVIREHVAVIAEVAATLEPGTAD